MATFYHVTTFSNWQKIKQRGALIPQIGPRSQKAHEPKAFIYLFKNRIDADDNTMNWLGDEFNADEAIAYLKITLNPHDTYLINDPNQMEALYQKPIKLNQIQLINVEKPDDDNYDI